MIKGTAEVKTILVSNEKVKGARFTVQGTAHKYGKLVLRTNQKGLYLSTTIIPDAR